MPLQFQINTFIKYISRKGLGELRKKYPANSPQYIKTLKHRATAVTVFAAKAFCSTNQVRLQRKTWKQLLA